MLFLLLTMAMAWEGEIGYRVTVIPEGSAGARNGLRIGDILAEPGQLPGRLRASGADSVEIPLYRLDKSKGSYERTKLRVVFKDGEEKRLGTMGDFGFLVTKVSDGSAAARAGLQAGDFIPKVNETFVHDVKDLQLVDDAYAKGDKVLIHVTRWVVAAQEFQTLKK